MGDKRVYPRVGEWQPNPNPGVGRRCAGCNGTVGVGMLHIQVSHFRGDDVVVRCCVSCRDRVSLGSLMERASAPGLVLALDTVVKEVAGLRADLARVTGERDEAMRQLVAAQQGWQCQWCGKTLEECLCDGDVVAAQLAALRAAIATTPENVEWLTNANSFYLSPPVAQAILQAITTRATAGGGEAATPVPAASPEDGKPTTRCACGSIAVTRTGCAASTEESAVVWGPWTCSRCGSARYAPAADVTDGKEG